MVTPEHRSTVANLGFGLAFVGAVWLTIAGYAVFVQPWIDFPYQVAVNGSMGNPIVTGTNPWTGLTRFCVLWVVLVAVGLVFTSRVLAGRWEAFVSSAMFPVCAFVGFLPIVGASWGRFGRTVDIVLAAISVAVAWRLSRRQCDGGEPNMSLSAYAAVALCGLGLGVPIQRFLCLDPFSSERLLSHLVGACLALLVVLFSYRPRAERSYAGDGRADVALVVVSLSGALAAFNNWPAGAALAWIATAAVALLAWYAAARMGRTTSPTLQGILWALVVPLAVVGLSGSPTLQSPYIDAHHEAEAILPAWFMQSGRVPFRDFTISHSLAVDCIPSWVAFKVWGTSVYAERMFIGFIAAPLRALLVWWLLARWFPKVQAVLIWCALALSAQFLFVTGDYAMPFTNEVLRLEPALIVLLLWMDQRGTHGRMFRLAAVVATPICAVLSPEVGVPLTAGIIIVLIVRLVPVTSRRTSVLALAALTGSGVATVLYLCGHGMVAGLYEFTLTRNAFMAELVARSSQSVLNGYVLLHIMVLSVGIVVMWRRGVFSESNVLLVPLLTVAAASTFGLFADSHYRFARIFIVDFPCMAAAMVPVPGRDCRYALPCLSLMLLSLFVRTSVPYERSMMPSGAEVKGMPRIGAIRPVPGESQLWQTIVEWGKEHRPYFNASDSMLDYFLCDQSVPVPFIPMHTGYRPSDQMVLIETLESMDPVHVLFRTERDMVFWNVTPYTLMFHVLDAHILERYEFDRMVGPYHTLVRSQQETTRTYNDLISPDLRRPLKYGWAPFFLGAKRGEGIGRVMVAATGVPMARRCFWRGVIKGGGSAIFRICPTQMLPNRHAVTEVLFSLKDDGIPHEYCVPLWNLCHWKTGNAEDSFRFVVDVPEGTEVHGSGVVCGVVGGRDTSAKGEP